MGFRVLHEIVKFIEPLPEELGNKRVLDNCCIRLARQQRFPGLTPGTELVTDLPLHITIRVQTSFAQLALPPHGRDSTFVPVPNTLAL